MTELAVDWLRMYAGSIILVCAFVLWWVFSGIDVQEPTSIEEILEEHNRRFQRTEELEE